MYPPRFAMPSYAGNAAALSNKLSQMANGAVYGEDKRVFQIHDRKLDALEDLISGTNTKHRVGFNEMIEDALAGKIEIKTAELIQFDFSGAA